MKKSLKLTPSGQLILQSLTDSLKAKNIYHRVNANGELVLISIERLTIINPSAFYLIGEDGIRHSFITFAHGKCTCEIESLAWQAKIDKALLKLRLLAKNHPDIDLIYL